MKIDKLIEELKERGPDMRVAKQYIERNWTGSENLSERDLEHGFIEKKDYFRYGFYHAIEEIRNVIEEN